MRVASSATICACKPSLGEILFALRGNQMAILCCLIVPIGIASSPFKCQASVDPGLCNGGPQISGKNAASKMQKNFGQLKLNLCMDRISFAREQLQNNCSAANPLPS